MLILDSLCAWYIKSRTNVSTITFVNLTSNKASNTRLLNRPPNNK